MHLASETDLLMPFEHTEPRFQPAAAEPRAVAPNPATRQEVPAERFQVADRIAIALSGLCAVHCALTPVLLSVLPFLGSHAFEDKARLALGTLGIVAIGFGMWVHRSARALPFLLAALGLFVWLTLSHPPYEEALSVLASALLIAAHWTNLRAVRACDRHGHHA